jgi:hypothetical protein
MLSLLATALKNMLIFSRKHKLIFSIIVIVQLISLVATIFVYFIYRVTSDPIIETIIRLREFTVELKNLDFAKNIESANKLIGANRSVIDQLSFRDDAMYLQIDFIFNEIYSTHIGGNGTYIKSDNEIVLSQQYENAYSYPIGSRIRFLGNYFTIVGKTWGNYSIISASSAIDNTTIRPNRLIIYVKTIPTDLQIDSLNSEIIKYFPSGSVTPPRKYEASDDALFQLLIMLSVFAISLLNVAYLYSYLLQAREKYIRIMRICGYSRLHGMFIILSENVTLSLVLFVLSTIIAELALPTLIPVLTNHQYTYYFSALEYLLVYSIYFALLLVVFSSVIHSTLRELMGG